MPKEPAMLLIELMMEKEKVEGDGKQLVNGCQYKGEVRYRQCEDCMGTEMRGYRVMETGA